MPQACSSMHWSRIRLHSGLTTSVSPPTSAKPGSWKQRLLPEPVAMSTRQSSPLIVAFTTARWPGRNSCRPKRSRSARSTCSSQPGNGASHCFTAFFRACCSSARASSDWTSCSLRAFSCSSSLRRALSCFRTSARRLSTAERSIAPIAGARPGRSPADGGRSRLGAAAAAAAGAAAAAAGASRACGGGAKSSSSVRSTAPSKLIASWQQAACRQSAAATALSEGSSAPPWLRSQPSDR